MLDLDFLLPSGRIKLVFILLLYYYGPVKGDGTHLFHKAQIKLAQF